MYAFYFAMQIKKYYQYIVYLFIINLGKYNKTINVNWIIKYNVFINFGITNFIFKLNYCKNNHINALIITKIIKQYIVKTIIKTKQLYNIKV